jgi:phosphoribosyl 1,2-cyclic phosphate phosphodiesterase
MLTHEVSKLDGILFTHEHADHTAGIDDIRPFFFRQGDIPIYAHERVISSLRQRFDYIFADVNRYPGAPAVEVNLVEKDKPFKIGDTMVIPIEAQHNRLPVLGYRINDFTYLTDVKTVTEEELEKIKGSQVLVVNALREEPHHSHFNLSEAIAFSEKVGAPKTYFTHMSHLLGFHEDVEKKLPKGVLLAYDNLVINL